MNADEINAFFAQAFGASVTSRVDRADGETAIVRVPYNPGQLRPGGTISGPTMMSLADTAAYALVLSAIGFEPLSVTTNLSINFLRKPAPKDLIAEGRMLKLGKGLAICDVAIRSDGERDLVAHAVVTYSIPPKKREAGT
jgi:uncharacterized protein (TIGR00369 family)